MKNSLLIVLICFFRVSLGFGQDNSQNDNSGIVVAQIPDQIYSGVAFTPEPVIKDGIVTLIKNKDYTVNYSNNVNVGTATITIVGKGNYTDTKEVKFNITPKSINQIVINPVPDQTFRNALITPDILIKDVGRTLIKDTDYTLSYSNNMNVGTASITVTGKGNYKDSKNVTFRIVAKSMGGIKTLGRPVGAYDNVNTNVATANTNNNNKTVASTNTATKK